MWVSYAEMPFRPEPLHVFCQALGAGILSLASKGKVVQRKFLSAWDRPRLRWRGKSA